MPITVEWKCFRDIGSYVCVSIWVITFRFVCVCVFSVYGWIVVLFIGILGIYARRWRRRRNISSKDDDVVGSGFYDERSWTLIVTN